MKKRRVTTNSQGLVNQLRVRLTFVEFNIRWIIAYYALFVAEILNALFWIWMRALLLILM